MAHYNDIAPTLPDGIVSPDQLLGGRFRLNEKRGERGGIAWWDGVDENLARRVNLYLLPPDHPQTDEVLAVARQTGVVTDPRFLMTLDVQAFGPSEPVSFIVCEDWPGISLQTLLRQGPLPDMTAAWIVNEIAAALAPLHEQGLCHGELNPATVYVTTTGTVRIKGFMLFAVLAGHPVTDPKAGERSDVLAIGRLLYATLACAWPGDRTMSAALTFGLPPAKWLGGMLQAPRRVRSGVSQDLDSLCMRILQPPEDATQVVTARLISNTLQHVLGTTDASQDLADRVKAGMKPPVSPDSDASKGQSPPPQSTVSQPSDETDRPTGGSSAGEPRPGLSGATKLAKFVARWPRWWVAVPVVLIIILAALMLRSCAPSSPPPADLPISAITEMDATADGGDGQENSSQVPLATDGQTDTCWTTEQYPANYIPNNKPGVGLVLDLGESRHLATLSVTFGTVPAGVSVMVPDDQSLDAPPLDSVTNWTMLTTATVDSSPQTITLPDGTTTRFVMLYFTSLPTATDRADRVQGVVCEVTATG